MCDLARPGTCEVLINHVIPLQPGALYFVPYVNNSSGSSQTTKPVTVRSVKRRDRSKSVERERRQRQESDSTESAPVMV